MKVTIEDMQNYLLGHYGRGANDLSLFMKLVEETGEVAEVLNKRDGRKATDGADLTGELAKELADVIHYAVAIAAVNGIDLTQAIVSKDRKAAVKYGHVVDLETFIRSRECSEQPTTYEKNENENT